MMSPAIVARSHDHFFYNAVRNIRCSGEQSGCAWGRRRRSRDSHKSVAGRPEQLADVGRGKPALRGQNDYASAGSGPTRQSDARCCDL